MSTNFARVLKDYPDEFMRCRFYNNHAFFPTGRQPERPWTDLPSGTKGVQSQCSSCGCERDDWIDTRGRIVRRYYRYADGYMIPLEPGERIPVEVKRKEQLRRMTLIRKG